MSDGAIIGAVALASCVTRVDCRQGRGQGQGQGPPHSRLGLLARLILLEGDGFNPDSGTRARQSTLGYSRAPMYLQSSRVVWLPVRDGCAAVDVVIYNKKARIDVAVLPLAHRLIKLQYCTKKDGAQQREAIDARVDYMSPFGGAIGVALPVTSCQYQMFG
ncbi:hypothetical protein BDV95DRAFT_641462 [Massariosphaeria phaeospora]|uniref:Uncharacterized protein n=1 Tax=Massariosphaeria phaeospora TaxID=100035 RepID=A0A7C8I726_9PLEO|nr:hypothetical protein BDV95DRAFT_641462 [Massariosphaeria phaeospora]